MIKNLIKKGLACLLVLTVLITSSGFTDPAIVYADTISAKAGETSEVDEEIGDTEMSGAESDDTGGSDSESDDANVINSTSGDTDAIDTECDNTEVSEAESSDTEVMDGMTDDTEVIAPESGETNETNTDSENTDMTDDGRTESPEENADALVDDTLEETTAVEAPDGDYICTLELEETNPMLRMMDNSSSLPISYSSYEVFWPAHGIMYVDNDDQYPDSMGTWRLVYCYDQGKATPSGTLKFSGWSNKKVAYAMYYGTMYWGQTCRYAPYSTGDWKLDAMATQSAIWVLSGQYTLDHVVNYIIDWCNGTATDAQRKIVEAATEKIVNDANKESYYTGWNTDGWFDLSLSGKTTFDITGYKNTWTDNGAGYYVSGGAFKTTFKSYYGYDMRSQITSFTVDVPDGVEVVKADSKTFSDFSLRIPEDQYKAWTKTGKEITVTVTMKIPRLWSAGLYQLSDSNYQRTTLFTYKSKSDTATFSKTITLTIPKEEIPYGKLKIQKSSALSDITDGNSCYSLADAKYSVYSDKNCTTEVGTLVTDEDGNTEALTLETGTYYIRETESPNGYLLDTKTYSVSLTKDHYETPYTKKVKDTPETDLIDILLKKVDAETGQGVPQNTATLEGAVFTVKYYDVSGGDKDPAKSGYEPVKTWVFQTDADGYVYLDEEHFVKGDALYLGASGAACIPLGTVTIQETKAPEGYLRNTKVFVVPVSADGSDGITSYAVPIISDNVFKLNLTKTEAGTSKVISGAVFAHIRPNGEEETLTTDENGQLSFIGLEWGDHIIREVSAPDGYRINETEVRFTVSETNGVTVQSPSSFDGTGITLGYSDNTDISMTVENGFAPYRLRLLKQNAKGQALAGTEFTLYKDKNCTKAVESKVTDSDGSLIFDDLPVGETRYCRETKAPKGYALPEEVVVFEIYAESSPVDGVFDFSVNGETYTIDDSDANKDIYLSGSAADRMINIFVVNTVGMLLPETGSGMTLVLYLLGTALMTGMLVINEKNKKHTEERSL